MFERIVNVFPALGLATLLVAGGIFLPETGFALESYTIPQTTGAAVSWEPNVSKPEGYRIYQRKKGESFNYAKPCWTGPGTTGRVYNLEYDTVYYFVVRAYNGALESVDSSEVSFIAASTRSGHPFHKGYGGNARHHIARRYCESQIKYR